VEHAEELAREHRVRSLSLFGSVAHDEAGPASDVDVLVELNPPVSLFTLGGLQQYLEGLLGREVGVVLRTGIKRQLQERILSEELPVLVSGPDGGLVAAAREAESVGIVERRRRGGAVAERNWKMRIEDILEAIEAIAQHTEGLDFEGFVADRRAMAAVRYEFVVIGEAERHIPPEVEARYPSVLWAKMRGMRNVLVHDYPRVDPAVVWETARDDLAPLGAVLREILEREP
jgi:uncharacterized protein with HEPN domain/predicted nucleotidyltransferase